MKTSTTPFLAGLLILTTSPTVIADDWPQWRGPLRDGISQETGLLKAWPKDGPKLLWQVQNVGSGYSTPSIVGDRLYLISNTGLDQEFAQARRVEDGGQIWSAKLGKVGNPDQKPNYPGARSTPTVDGNRLYALGSDGDLVCLETGTGKLVWRKHLRNDFNGKPGEWAYAESPLIDGNALVCAPGGSEATLAALNKATGEVIWKCALSEGDQASYASIVVTEIGGVKQYVQFLHKGLVGVNAKTGELLWRFAQTADLRSGGNIPTPVVHNGAVYSAAGLVGGGLARIQVKGGLFEAQSVYFSKKLPTGIGGTVLVGGHLYGTSGPMLQCVELATGIVKWEERSVGSASVCYADGRLYLHGENNEMALIDPTPEGYREKGRFTLSNQPDRGRSKAWTYPAIANGRLYIHDFGALWCFDIKGN